MNVGPKQEGSHATFTCNDGYRLLGSSKMTCRDGEWGGGTKPTCDVDDCKALKDGCGGPSSCIDGIGNFTCKCAKGWSGGGVNQTCKRGKCRCTGNKGFWKAKERVVEEKLPSGRIRKQLYSGYDYSESYGMECAAHEIKHHKPDYPEDWMIPDWYAFRPSCDDNGRLCNEVEVIFSD